MLRDTSVPQARIQHDFGGFPDEASNENAAPSAKGAASKSDLASGIYKSEIAKSIGAFDDLLGDGESMHVVQARRVELVQNGYRPIPVDGKRPHLSGWQKFHADAMDVRQWSKSHARAANTGIVLGADLVAIDIDILDEGVSADLVGMAVDLGNGPPLVRVGLAPKTLLLYRTDRPIKKRATGVYSGNDKDQKVEVLGDGQQFVTDGIHPDTGKPYRWLTASPIDVPAARLPLIDHDKLDLFLAKAEERLQCTGWTCKVPRKAEVAELPLLEGEREHLPVEECRRILADLEEHWRDANSYWHRVGCALHHNFQGGQEGLDLWIEFSKPGPHFDRRELLANWKSMKPRANPVTMGTLIEAASEAREKRREAELDALIEDFGEEPKEEAEKPRTAKLQFLTPSDCAAMPSRGYVVKGFIAPGDVACIFGEPGAGKSMIAPYLGYMVALGQCAFGMRTKQGGVFYVPAEDETGMQMRVRALKEHHGEADNFFVVRGVSINTDDGLKDMLSEVKRQRPALIVLDTLAAAFPGLEENSSEAMSKVVHVGKRLAAFGAAVVFIHHSTKDSNGTPRGHSVLNGALDVSMELFKADEHGIARGRLKKNRNGPCDRDIAFRIQSHEFGFDEDGDPVTAGYCQELLAGSIPTAVKLNASERAAVEILKDMMRTSADLSGQSPGVSGEEWRRKLTNSKMISASEEPESRKRVMRRVVQSLFRKGMIDEFAGVVRFVDEMSDDGFEDQGAYNAFDL